MLIPPSIISQRERHRSYEPKCRFVSHLRAAKLEKNPPRETIMSSPYILYTLPAMWLAKVLAFAWVKEKSIKEYESTPPMASTLPKRSMLSLRSSLSACGHHHADPRDPETQHMRCSHGLQLHVDANIPIWLSIHSATISPGSCQCTYPSCPYTQVHCTNIPGWIPDVQVPCANIPGDCQSTLSYYYSRPHVSTHPHAYFLFYIHFIHKREDREAQDCVTRPWHRHEHSPPPQMVHFLGGGVQLSLSSTDRHVYYTKMSYF